MRVALSLVALFASAEALIQSVAKRETLDDCSYVDSDLEVSNPLTGHPVVLGHLGRCLCLSGIPAAMESEPVLVSSKALVGVAKTQAAVKTLVTSARNRKHCKYPDNCDPVCTAEEPCGFNCHKGFTPWPTHNPTDCICKSPNHICNGVCSSTPCPSSGPKKRDLDEWKKRAICEAGFTACGLYNGFRNGPKFECIDTKSDLESCGGCSIPLHEKSPRGVDCTSLIGVADVSCRAGECFVHRCMPGYELAFDNSMCVDVETFSRFVPFLNYDVKHVPLSPY